MLGDKLDHVPGQCWLCIGKSPLVWRGRSPFGGPPQTFTPTAKWRPPRNAKHPWLLPNHLSCACPHLSNPAHESTCNQREKTTSLPGTDLSPHSVSSPHHVEWCRGPHHLLPHAEMGNYVPLLPCGASFLLFFRQPHCGSSQKCSTPCQSTPTIHIHITTPPTPLPCCTTLKATGLLSCL